MKLFSRLTSPAVVVSGVLIVILLATAAGAQTPVDPGAPSAAERAALAPAETLGASAISFARDEGGRWTAATRPEAVRAAAIERARWSVQDLTAFAPAGADLDETLSAHTIAGIAARVDAAPVQDDALQGGQ